MPTERLQRLYPKLKQCGLDGLLVSLPANISYLVEFTSRDSYVLVSEKYNTYFTDSRYTDEAKKYLKESFQLKKTNGSVFKLIAQTCLEAGLKKIGFEERYLPYAEYKKIQQHLGKSARLIPVNSLLEEIRRIKEPQEVEKIRQATRITVQALKYIKKYIRPGKKEVEIAGELERFMRYNGAGRSAFELIVAAGANSAFAHHLSCDKKTGKNDVVLIDIGADYEGYKSDLTRVFFLGKINFLARRVYEVVREAQLIAIDKIRPGCPISEVDRAARDFIAKNGFGPNFSHNLGHGVGLEVHEAPQISPKQDVELQPGMVFTVEPAAYLPGKFGIRIEDIVLVTKKGCEVLSGLVKPLSAATRPRDTDTSNNM